MEVITCYDENDVAIINFTQWEYGRKVIFDGDYGDQAIVADFCVDGAKESYRMEVSDYDTGRYVASVPNKLLENSQSIFMFISTLSDETSQTIAFAKFPVRARPMPDDYIESDNEQYISLILISEEMQKIMDEATAAEAERNANEEERVENEEKREETTANAITAANNAIEAANTAIAATNDAIANAESATEATNSAINAANDATTSANNATNEANTATDAAYEAIAVANVVIEEAEQLIEELLGVTSGKIEDWAITFDEAEKSENIVSGETLSELFGKIQKFINSRITDDQIDALFI